MTISQDHANTRAGVLVHVDAVRGSVTSSASDFGTPRHQPATHLEPQPHTPGVLSGIGGNTAQGNRRMVAVTVALSEPLDAPELDWPGTIAANLRLLYSGTTVEIIDTWRTDQ